MHHPCSRCLVCIVIFPWMGITTSQLFNMVDHMHIQAYIVYDGRKRSWISKFISSIIWRSWWEIPNKKYTYSTKNNGIPREKKIAISSWKLLTSRNQHEQEIIDWYIYVYQPKQFVLVWTLSLTGVVTGEWDQFWQWCVKQRRCG